MRHTPPVLDRPNVHRLQAEAGRRTVFWGLLAAALGALALQLWWVAPRLVPGPTWLVLDSQPRGAEIFMPRFALGRLQEGPVGAGAQLYRLGRTPCRLELAVSEAPARLLLALPGYANQTVDTPGPGRVDVVKFTRPKHFWVVPLYFLRDYGLAVAAGVAIAVAFVWQLRSRRHGWDFEHQEAALELSGVSPGAVVDGWRVLARLGSGGMGAVWLVERPSGERAALKILHASGAQDERGRQRFDREVALLSQLRHPGVVLVLGWGEVVGHRYLMLELLEGESLSDRLERGGLDEGDALRVGLQMARALEYVHSQGVVHRDLKPSNVWLAKSGPLKLLDFGIAVSERTRVSSHGDVLGTPGYLAPERLAGDDALDWRSDLYSLGVILYEMVAGRPPFEGGAPLELLQRHLTEAPPPLGTACRPELEALIMRLLSKAPQDRAESGKALSVELEELVRR